MVGSGHCPAPARTGRADPIVHTTSPKELRDRRKSRVAFLSASGLTARQSRFVEEYLVDLSASRAGVRAGFSIRMGPRLVRKSAVAAAIQAAVAERSRRTRVSQDSVIDELAKLAFSNMRDLVSWGPDGVRVRDSVLLTEHASVSVAEVSHVATTVGSSTKLRLHDKVAALRLLGQHLGMFGTEHDAAGGSLTTGAYVLMGGQTVFF